MLGEFETMLGEFEPEEDYASITVRTNFSVGPLI
jgi:hypothetical protein